MAIDRDGTLWLAGHSRKRRSEVALLAFAERGPGEHKVRPT